MRDTLIAAKAVSCTFHQGGRPVIAVQAADFLVEPGDRIAIVGPSSCGKSTLLHLMGGLVTAASGSIAWPGLGAFSQLRPSQIAMVFQGPSLMPELTGRENVSLPLLLADGDPVSSADAMAALALFDLDALSDKLPKEMSGGQIQRIALARAVATRPKLILADEPTGQLDQATRDDVLDRLLTSLADTTTALVITTHDPDVATRMRKVWHMRHGVLTTGPGRLEIAA